LPEGVDSISNRTYGITDTIPDIKPINVLYESNKLQYKSNQDVNQQKFTTIMTGSNQHVNKQDPQIIKTLNEQEKDEMNKNSENRAISSLVYESETQKKNNCTIGHFCQETSIPIMPINKSNQGFGTDPTMYRWRTGIWATILDWVVTILIGYLIISPL
jgi:tRNA G10  N-methylase Trm11